MSGAQDMLRQDRGAAEDRAAAEGREAGSDRDTAQGREMARRLLAAIGIAREAGSLMRTRYQARPQVLSLNFKGPQDYLTETDGEVEAFVRAQLAEAFPEDGFLGEEGGGALSDRLWVVDPIDGTANFARGIPHFCISMAYVEAGQVEVGVIFNPMTHEMYAARRGHGATLDGRPMRVSGITDFRQCTIELGWSPRLPPEPYVDALSAIKHAGANVRRGGSGALGLAYVADGRIDAYAELHINAWDALAGILLIQEAGGYVNDFLAGEGLSKGNPILGCTPAIAASLRDIMGLDR